MKGETMNRLKMLVTVALRVCPSLMIALALLGGSQGIVFAGATPFSQLIVFGDSMSDNGNCYKMSLELWGPQWAYPPSPPYWEGRCSNGKVWAEYLAQDLKMAALLDDYAVIGATTGTANNGLPFGGVQDQLARYFSSHTADPDALYIVWAGHNDFFIAATTGQGLDTWMSEAVQNTVLTVRTLWEAGARHILVANLADMGLLPSSLFLGPEISHWISFQSTAHDQALKVALQDLAAGGIPTIFWDAFASHRAVSNWASEVVFIDVTDPYLPIGVQAGDDPAQYLYWDATHPTTHGHRLLADAARNCLIDYYSPRHGKSSPPGLVNALHGLVQAGKGK